MPAVRVIAPVFAVIIISALLAAETPAPRATEAPDSVIPAPVIVVVEIGLDKDKVPVPVAAMASDPLEVVTVLPVVTFPPAEISMSPPVLEIPVAAPSCTASASDI